MSRRLLAAACLWCLLTTASAVTRRQVPDAAVASKTVMLTGYRVEKTQKASSIDEDLVVSVLQDSDFTLRFFGVNLTQLMRVKFAKNAVAAGDSCNDIWTTQAFPLEDVEASGATALVRLSLPRLPSGAAQYYVCLSTADGDAFFSQGDNYFMMIRTFPPLLPVALHVALLIMLLFLSGLFSGLNLGLMALTLTELKIVLTTGSENEKGWARDIIPVRSHGNYLLCTLLLGNVLVNSSLTILLDDLTSGIVAVIGSTLGIVLCGEIVPQALCSRHGLAVGSKTIYLTKLFMVLTAPLSFPISLVLDKLLGEEIGNTYNRDRLKELIKLNKDDMGLANEEQNIIYGALDLKAKTVAEIMTQLEDVYMLSIDAILDYTTISEIMAQGYSRIPVYDNEPSNIVAVMFAKDLAFVDPDDCTPVKTLCQFYQNPWSFVYEDVTLDSMLREFKTGHKGHMALVQRVITETDGDPYYQVIGLVTLEDVIEEMIQAEIVDETDVLTDNRTKKRRGRKRLMPDPTAFSGPTKSEVVISPQLSLAAFQFMQTLDSFKSELILPSVLKRVLEQDVIRQIKVRADSTQPLEDHSDLIYELGKPVDFFVLILEGRVQATIGRERLHFESGPFSVFGLQALTMPGTEGEIASSIGAASNTTGGGGGPRGSVLSLDTAAARLTFPAEYTLRAITDVLFMKIRRAHYLAARRSTLMFQSSGGSQAADDQLTADMARVVTDSCVEVRHRVSAAPSEERRSGGSDPDSSEQHRSLINHANSADGDQHLSV